MAEREGFLPKTPDFLLFLPQIELNLSTFWRRHIAPSYAILRHLERFFVSRSYHPFVNLSGTGTARITPQTFTFTASSRSEDITAS